MMNSSPSPFHTFVVATASSGVLVELEERTGFFEFLAQNTSPIFTSNETSTTTVISLGYNMIPPEAAERPKTTFHDNLD